jgi:translation initiation factor IF-2
MKTLTELSGTMIRRAAAAVAEAKRSLPKVEAPVAEAEAPAAPVAEAAAPVEGEAAPVEAAPVPVASAPAKGKPAEVPESEAVKAALDAAVGEATGLSGDRLSRLRDAVHVVGHKVADVRLVRVFGVEEPVAGATTLNGFQYLCDIAPATMRQEQAPQKKDRGGRGGGGAGRGGGAPGGGGKGAPTSGGFSMDSLKEDRKGQRSGPGGRGKPGGGRPGGGPR